MTDPSTSPRNADDTANGGTEPTRGRIVAWLLAMTALALILRVLMAGFHHDLNMDAAYIFLPCAERIAAGDWHDGLDHSVPTGFLVMHGVWLWLHGGDPEFGARILTAILGALLVPAVYGLGRQFFGPRAALWGSALMIFNPQLVQFSGRVSSEVPYALFLVLAAWVGIVAIRHRGWVYPPLAGFAVALSYLIRPEGMVLLPILVAGLLRRGRRDRALLVSCVSVVMVISAFIIGATPMIAVNYRATGHFSLSNKGGISLERREGAKPPLALTDDHESTLIRHALSREGYKSFNPLTPVLEDPFGFIARATARLGKLTFRYMPRVLGVGILAGLLIVAFFPKRVAPMTRGSPFRYLGVTLAVYLAALSIFFESDRFVLPMAPLFAVLAGPGVVIGLAQARRMKRTKLALAVLLLVVLSADAARAVRKLDKFDGFVLGWRTNPTRMVGETIGERFGATRILSPPGGQLAYYAGAEPVIFPIADFDALLDYARHREVELIVYQGESITNFIRDWPREEPTGLVKEGVIEQGVGGQKILVHVWRLP